jgi:hypothetical protein
MECENFQMGLLEITDKIVVRLRTRDARAPGPGNPAFILFGFLGWRETRNGRRSEQFVDTPQAKQSK